MPVRNADDEIVAVVQVINKSNDTAFSKEDEKVGWDYLTKTQTETYLSKREVGYIEKPYLGPSAKNIIFV